MSSPPELDDSLLAIPTKDLREWLLRDWQQPQIVSYFDGLRWRISDCLALVFRRSFDEVESVKIAIETVIERVNSRVIARELLVGCAVAHVQTTKQARIVLEFARSIPDHALGNLDVPYRKIALYAVNPDLWISVGAICRRVNPSDRTLMTHDYLPNVRLLARHGESPDEVDGGCPALEDISVSLILGLEGKSDSWLAFDCVVWFSDLNVEWLTRSVLVGDERACDRRYMEARLQDIDPKYHTPVDELIFRLEHVIMVRDLVRPLIDYRRQRALKHEFSRSPLRLLPHHAMIQCLEFLVYPSASKLWVRAPELLSRDALN